jgi:hypothetical protein
MDERFGYDTLIALATVGDNIPNVQIIRLTDAVLFSMGQDMTEIFREIKREAPDIQFPR